MSQVLEEIAKPKDEPLILECYNDKYERSQVEYPDSKKHVGLLYDPHGNYHTITQKREIVKRFMDAGSHYAEWYAAPVWDLARELGLAEQEEEEYQERHTEAINTCNPIPVPSADPNWNIALLQNSFHYSVTTKQAFDSVMAAHYFCRMVDIIAGVATVVAIIAIPLVLVWILR